MKTSKRLMNRRPLLSAYRKHSLVLCLGFVLLLFSLIPSVLLRDNAYIIVHDQLDGEVTNYVLLAKHLNDKTIPEFMSGEDNKNSLTPASYGTLLFFIIFNPDTAFILNECFVRAAAFLGMFLLLMKFHVQDWIAVISAFLFSLLNFYPVYGLSVMGQPLLLYAYIQAKGKRTGILPYLAAIFFAACSSPVLAGYVDVIILAVVLIFQLIKKSKGARETAVFMIVLILTYCFLYRNLLMQVVGGAGFVSHRSEWVLRPEGQWNEVFSDIYKNGIYHAEASQGTLVPWIIATACVGMVFYTLWDREQKYWYKKIWTLLAGTVIAAAIYATWRSEPTVSLRQKLGGLFVTFSLQRCIWINPLLWWTSFGLTLQIMNSFATENRFEKIHIEKKPKIATAVIAIVFLISTFVNIYDSSPLKQNLIRLTEGTNDNDVSFRSFYSEDLFDKIKEYIGKPQDSYKVGSVALYPSVPLYNGFYCIDGYSNNYDVEYKHAFQKIISPELDKKESLKTYFIWGNRCYLFSAELGKKYYFTKYDTKEIKKLEYDTEAMRQLGCEYILSGVNIRNAEDIGLILLNTFEDEESPYRIRLYQIKNI